MLRVKICMDVWNRMISQCGQNVAFFRLLQWNLSMKDTPNKGHICNEDTVCSPNHVELSRNRPLELGNLSIQGSQWGPKGVLHREVPL